MTTIPDNARDVIKKSSSQKVIASWYSKVVKRETAPLLLAVGGGVVLAGWFGFRHLTTSPDVKINKVARKATIRENQAEGQRWIKHRESMKQLVPSSNVHEAFGDAKKTA